MRKQSLLSAIFCVWLSGYAPADMIQEMQMKAIQDGMPAREGFTKPPFDQRPPDYFSVPEGYPTGNSGGIAVWPIPRSKVSGRPDGMVGQHFGGIPVDQIPNSQFDGTPWAAPFIISERCGELSDRVKLAGDQLAVCNKLSESWLVEIDNEGAEKSRFFLAFGEQKIITFTGSGKLIATISSNSGPRKFGLVRSTRYILESIANEKAITLFNGPTAQQ